MVPIAEILFWTSMLIIFYTYAGYPLLLTTLVKIKRSLWPPMRYSRDTFELPSVTLIIAAYNEEKILPRKIENTLKIDYPREKFEIIFVTDGSDDRSNDIIKQFPLIKLLYEPQRKGKLAAVNRAISFTETEIVVFSDANALLNPESIKKIVTHYLDPKTGGVAGEKKIFNDHGVAGGEGAYWRYESYLKKLDAELYSVVGAAGELFSMRSAMYIPLNEDIILDDFVQSLLVCKMGYKVKYEPEAFATEYASSSLADEKERKIRISAGGFQAMVRLKTLLNFFRFGTLSFQYISHRVLRWTLCPLSLIVALPSSIYLYIYSPGSVYTILFVMQMVFYLMAVCGSFSSYRVFYLPFYFCFMNFCVVAGFLRYLLGKQKPTWQKASRTRI